MSRTSICIPGLVICFLLSGATAQDKSGGKGGKGSKGMTKTVTEGPEPSYVYGYISLVDPRTSEKHLILDRDYDPPAVRGYPTWHVVFRNARTEALHRVTFMSNIGLYKYGTPPVALIYYMPLIQDRSEAGAPRQVTRAEYPRYVIRYNSDVWRYHTIEMEPYSYRPDGAASHVRELIPLRRRARPFPEFPDIPEGAVP